MTRETAIGQLLRLMAEESETNWCCSWGPQHEFVLWASVVGDEPESGKGWVEDPGRLKELASLAGGWLAWSEEADDVEFVPMGQWLAMYGRYRVANRTPPGR